MKFAITVLPSFVIVILSYFPAFSAANNVNNSELIDLAIDQFQESLVENGFENIRIKIAIDKTLLIEYENRRYRYEMTALKIVLTSVVRYLSPFTSFIIVPLNRNIPIVHIFVKASDYQNFRDGILTLEEFSEKFIVSQSPKFIAKKFIYQTESVNSSYFRSDIIFNPGFKVQFSRPNDPAQLQFNLLPTFQTILAKGLQFQSQVILPFYNEFSKIETPPRFGITYLNQFARISNTCFASFSIGHFDEMQNGFSTQWSKYFFNSRCSFSAKIDYTTVARNWNKQFTLSYLLKAIYFFPHVDFSVDACWGHYLFADKTWRIDVLRSFGELDLGFMGIWNDYLGFLTGMIIQIPFPVPHQQMPKTIRLSSPQTIPWKYRYLPYSDGYILDTGTDIDTQFKKLTPTYIKNNLIELK